jgi:hypothetical protein
MLCGSSSKRLLFVTGSNGSNTQPEHRATLNSPESATRALFRTAPRKRRSSKCRFLCARHYCRPHGAVFKGGSRDTCTLSVCTDRTLAANRRCRSKAAVTASSGDVRYTPGSGHKPDMARRQLCAKRRNTRCVQLFLQQRSRCDCGSMASRCERPSLHPSPRFAREPSGFAPQCLPDLAGELAAQIGLGQ